MWGSNDRDSLAVDYEPSPDADSSHEATTVASTADAEVTPVTSLENPRGSPVASSRTGAAVAPNEGGDRYGAPPADDGSQTPIGSPGILKREDPNEDLIVEVERGKDLAAALSAAEDRIRSLQSQKRATNIAGKRKFDSRGALRTGKRPKQTIASQGSRETSIVKIMGPITPYSIEKLDPALGLNADQCRTRFELWRQARRKTPVGRLSPVALESSWRSYLELENAKMIDGIIERRGRERERFGFDRILKAVHDECEALSVPCAVVYHLRQCTSCGLVTNVSESDWREAIAGKSLGQLNVKRREMIDRAQGRFVRTYNVPHDWDAEELFSARATSASGSARGISEETARSLAQSKGYPEEVLLQVPTSLGLAKSQASEPDSRDHRDDHGALGLNPQSISAPHRGQSAEEGLDGGSGLASRVANLESDVDSSFGRLSKLGDSLSKVKHDLSGVRDMMNLQRDLGQSRGENLSQLKDQIQNLQRAISDAKSYAHSRIVEIRKRVDAQDKTLVAIQSSLALLENRMGVGGVSPALSPPFCPSSP